MIYSDIQRDYRERDCANEWHFWSKAIIWQIVRDNPRKRCKIGCKFVLFTNGKSHRCFDLDLQCPWTTWWIPTRVISAVAELLVIGEWSRSEFDIVTVKYIYDHRVAERMQKFVKKNSTYSFGRSWHLSAIAWRVTRQYNNEASQ